MSFSTVLETPQAILNTSLEFVPSLVGAVVVFIVGWIIAWFVQRIVEAIFKAVPVVDDSLRNIGLEEVTRRAGLGVNVGKFFGVILKVFIIIVSLIVSLEILGLEQINTYLISDVLSYIPNVITASIIVIVGFLLAEFLSNVVGRTANAAKVYGGVASSITKFAVIVFTVLFALAELGVVPGIINSLITGIIAGASLAIGLAFGLGGQEAAGQIIEKIRQDANK